jgi:hypothetical protein
MALSTREPLIRYLRAHAMLLRLSGRARAAGQRMEQCARALNLLAIARDRLFDVDLVIGRTLVYGALTAVLAAIFFGSVSILQQVLRHLIGGPDQFAVAGAALINGLLFQPLRRRIQLILARRIGSGRVEATRALAEFRATLRTREVSLDELRDGVLATVQDVLHPPRVGLWLRDRDGE